MYPRLIIDLAKIEANSRMLAALCAGAGIEPVGVTKATCGDPQVAKAMVAGGIPALAESRLENARRLKAAGIGVPLMLLRLPMLSQVQAVVELFDISLNSELATLIALDAAAAKAGVVHQVILMLELGDRREGIMPQELESTIGQLAHLKNIQLLGLGTNLTCYGGVIPTPANLAALSKYNHQAAAIYGQPLPVISGGNSSSLPLLLRGQQPPITQLRLGESILLGRETINRQPLPGAHLDCFQLEAEVIELKAKPSLPQGEISRDAFGAVPVIADRGIRRRAIIALGRQDIAAPSIEPPPGAVYLGASSDHLLLDVSDFPDPLSVGDRLTFGLGYGALLAAMTSAYVVKEYR